MRGAAPRTVHVIAASRHGSTAEVAEAIAERLRSHGHSVVCESAERAELPAAKDPVVIGSPIYMGSWLAPARKLLDSLAAESPGLDVFVFSLGPLGDPPKPEDARPEAEVLDFIRARARGSRIFTGRLERSGLGPLERLAIRAVKAEEGDFRDWAAIATWADEVSEELIATGASL